MLWQEAAGMNTGVWNDSTSVCFFLSIVCLHYATVYQYIYTVSFFLPSSIRATQSPLPVHRRLLSVLPSTLLSLSVSPSSGSSWRRPRPTVPLTPGVGGLGRPSVTESCGGSAAPRSQVRNEAPACVRSDHLINARRPWQLRWTVLNLVPDD